MATAARELRRYHSRPYTQRPGFAPAAIALVVGWTLVVCWFVAALLHFSRYSILGYFEFLMALGFSAFTVFMTFALVHENKVRMELLIDNDRVSLFTFDANDNSGTMRSMYFKDMLHAEHYKAADTGAVMLRGRAQDLEIPTWAFDHETDLILVELLREHHVEVRGVPRRMEVELQHHHHS